MKGPINLFPLCSNDLSCSVARILRLTFPSWLHHHKALGKAERGPRHSLILFRRGTGDH